MRVTVALLNELGMELDAPDYQRASVEIPEANKWHVKWTETKSDWGAVTGYEIYIDGLFLSSGLMERKKIVLEREMIALTFSVTPAIWNLLERRRHDRG